MPSTRAKLGAGLVPNRTARRQFWFGAPPTLVGEPRPAMLGGNFYSESAGEVEGLYGASI